MTTTTSTPEKGMASKKFGAFITSLAAVGGLMVVSSGVYASLNATTTNASATSVSSGTLKLSLAPSGVSGLTAGLTTPLSNLVPGDVVNRFIDLSNTGTLAGRNLVLSLVDLTPSALSTNSATGLQVQVSECSVEWSTVTGLCNGGSGTVIMQESPASTLTGSALPVAMSSLAAGSTGHLKLQISLPNSAETTVNGVLPAGSIQGASSSLNWTFSVEQLLPSNTSN
jgi:spore coat-associated protein N